MRFRIGNKLFQIRTDRQMTQAEFAELLNVPLSSYQRLEKNSTYASMENIAEYSKILDVPIQEFLPDTITFHNQPNQAQGGIVFGTYNYNYNMNKDEEMIKLQSENEKYIQENNHLKETIKRLEVQLADYRKLLNLQNEDL